MRPTVKGVRVLAAGEGIISDRPAPVKVHVVTEPKSARPRDGLIHEGRVFTVRLKSRGRWLVPLPSQRVVFCLPGELSDQTVERLLRGAGCTEVGPATPFRG